MAKSSILKNLDFCSRGDCDLFCNFGSDILDSQSDVIVKSFRLERFLCSFR